MLIATKATRARTRERAGDVAAIVVVATVLLFGNAVLRASQQPASTNQPATPQITPPQPGTVTGGQGGNTPNTDTNTLGNSNTKGGNTADTNCGYKDLVARGKKWNPFVRRDARNTFVFDHLRLRSMNADPYVLEVDDGGHFQVLFTCTAPAFFNYTITADPAAQPTSASGLSFPESIVVDTPLTTRGVTMRHDGRFLKYRVSARVRADLLTLRDRAATVPGAAPIPRPSPTARAGREEAATKPEETPTELYSVEFDLWVVTRAEWRLGIIAGVAKSALVDQKYAIKTDEKGAKTFVEDGHQDGLHIDTMALANVYYSKSYFRTFNPGLSFGLGTSGTSPRFFFGPSVVFGKYFVLHGGWAVGSVAAPPKGQNIGAPPVNGDNTLNSLSSRVTGRRYIGIGFTWIDRRDQFSAALSAAASASGAIGSCVTSVKPEAVTFDGVGAPSSAVEVEAGADCTWIATIEKGDAGFTIVSGGTAKGKGKIVLKGGTAGAAAKGDVLNIVGPMGSAPKQVKLSQAVAPKSCVTSLAPTGELRVTAAAVTPVVVTAPDCKWVAKLEPSTAGFSLSGTEGGGSLTLNVTAPAAAGSEDKTATLEVRGPSDAPAKTLKLILPKTP